MILCDTSGLLALLDQGERAHRKVARAVEDEPGPLMVTDFVLAETDYLILTRLGPAAERAFLAQLSEGIFLREPVVEEDLQRAHDIASRYADHALGITDSTLMALSERLSAQRILTLDRRHFGLFRDRKGRALELLPG